MAFTKDRKVVAIRELAETVPAQIVNGKDIPAKLADMELTREEALEFCVGQIARNDEKFVRSDDTRRGPETAAARDAWEELAFDIQAGLGNDRPVSLAAEFSKRYDARYTPGGKSKLDAPEMLASLLSMPTPDAPNLVPAV
jgi:hypothetical protein